MICEQCGNEFFGGKKVEDKGEVKIKCPYCYYLNPRVFNHKKKKKPENKPKE